MFTYKLPGFVPIPSICLLFLSANICKEFLSPLPIISWLKPLCWHLLKRGCSWLQTEQLIGRMMVFFFPHWYSLHHILYTKKSSCFGTVILFTYRIFPPHLLLAFWIIQQSVFSVIFSPLLFPLYGFSNEIFQQFYKAQLLCRIMIAR